MILQALTEYYQSLVQAEKIAAPGNRPIFPLSSVSVTKGN